MICPYFAGTEVLNALKLNPDDEVAMYKEAPGTARTYIHRALMRYRST